MIAIYILYFYPIIGMAFAPFFVFVGTEKINQSIKGSGIGLKLILIPAAAMFWPYLLKRVIQKK